MKVQFIDHSGFVVTTQSAVLVFDYYQGDLPDFDSELPVYVFVSHTHRDHFNPVIVDRTAHLKQVTYVMSFDIPMKLRQAIAEKTAPGQHQVIYMDADTEAAFPELSVRTLRSTDEGVAFIIEIGTQRIYFAGDLHWWTWPGEVEAIDQMMTDAYMKEMDKIRGMSFDLAFLVLDPRQEDRYWWGFDHFMKNTVTKCAFPMHMWGRFDLTERLMEREESAPYRSAIVPVHETGEIFDVSGYFDEP